MHSFPAEHARSPEDRKEEAYKARLQEIYEAGNLTRSVPLTLVTAMLLTMPKDQQRAVLGQVALLDDFARTDASRAALAYARQMVDGRDSEIEREVSWRREGEA